MHFSKEFLCYPGEAQGEMDSKSIRTRRLLKLKEAAVYLGVSAWTVRRLAQRGELPFVRFGQATILLFDFADLDTYIERNKYRGGV
jgi:excisionase family DNA binding protein